MRYRCTLVSLAALMVLLTALPAAAADTYKGDLLMDVGQLEEKVLGLAEAIPADKYSWVPSEGVRSVSGAMMHLAGANFFFPTLFGGAPPEGIDMRNLEQITEKDEVIDVLKKSFASLRSMIESVPDDELMTTISMFGQDATKAGALHAAVSHSHEHLGQLIAYARANEIVPPWSQ